jgi:hypothetical protein
VVDPLESDLFGGAPFETEKRHLDRRRVHWRVLVLQSGGGKIPCYTFDISEGGLGLLSRQAFPLKSSLSIALFVPDPKKPGKSNVLTLSANVIFQVMRNDEVHTGLQFTRAPVSAREVIRAAINALAK